MPSQRKHQFAATALPAWDFIPLVDWGDPALEDTGALGFSLLPRQAEMVLLESARTFFSVHARQGGVRRVLAEKMFVVPRHTDAPPSFFRQRRGEWTHIGIGTRATLYGLRSHNARSHALRLGAHYALSHEYALLYWQLGVANRTRQTLAIDTVTLLRVGPPRPVNRHRRTDFNPSRFRLFKLRRPPKTQSAYYDLTERFGSLRLHALDAPRVHVAPVSPEAAQQALPLPDFAVSYALVMQTEDARGGALLAVDTRGHPGAFRYEANTDRFAPGLTLRWQPEGLTIPARGGLALPKMALMWLTRQNPLARDLLQTP